MELYQHSSVAKWGNRTEDSSKHILYNLLPESYSSHKLDQLSLTNLEYGS